MKKLLCVLLSALVMALPMASFAQAESAPAAVQAESVTEGKLEQMIPVLDSFANAMGVEGEYVYDAQRPEFVWTQLYLMSVNWVNQYTEITQDVYKRQSHRHFGRRHHRPLGAAYVPPE